MKIRSKLLLLLLIIALVPLVISATLHHVSLYRFGHYLASDIRELLTEDAHSHLHSLVDEYGRLLQRNEKALELAVNFQASKVEHRLAARAPHQAHPSFSESGLFITGDHRQGYFVAKGADRKLITEGLARLSTMPETYLSLEGRTPCPIVRHYTILESGLETSYPGRVDHLSEYDPRGQSWYQRTKKKGELTWSFISEDSAPTMTLIAALPVQWSDGSFAGVTAIEVSLTSLFQELALSKQWAQKAERMLVAFDSQDEKAAGRLRIVAKHGDQERGGDWQMPAKREYLEPDASQELNALLKDVAAGRSGVRILHYRGEETHWVYGTRKNSHPFPLIIVPHEQIVTRAAQAEQHVLIKTIEGLKVTGIILFGAVFAVVVLAYFCSRAVIRPLSQVADAAERLAGGDYEARVDIQTGDELQGLGNVFNNMGSKLKERERMARSLSLAGEIQQHLLPQKLPKLKGFEIAGNTVYCDETGGDHFDFIRLMDDGGGKLGIAVGDVSGHGIEAALLMASARGVLRTHASCHGGDMGKLFNLLNHHLVRDTDDERFMTLFYGILEEETRSLLWNSGGHGPVYWLKSINDEILELPATGPPLGIFEDETYEPSGPIILDRGDVILIGTDGIWEAHNPAGDLFGTQRLRETLSKCSKMSAKEIFTTIMEVLNKFRATEPQEDDITLIVIKSI